MIAVCVPLFFLFTALQLVVLCHYVGNKVGSHTMISFLTNEDKGYVIITIKGSPTIEDYYDGVDDLAGHPSFNENMHRICDFSQVESLKVSSKELMAFIEKVCELPITSTVKTALIACNKDEQKLLHSFADGFEFGLFRVFETGRDALAWILWSDPVIAVKSDAKPEPRYHRLGGDITPAEAVQLQQSWFLSEEFDDQTPIIWDVRKAVFVASTPELGEVAGDMSQASRQFRPSARKAVLVASKGQDEMLSIAFRNTIEEGRLRIFWSAEEALAFVR